MQLSRALHFSLFSLLAQQLEDNRVDGGQTKDNEDGA
jgi:hypothetical protein